MLNRPNRKTIYVRRINLHRSLTLKPPSSSSFCAPVCAIDSYCLELCVSEVNGSFLCYASLNRENPATCYICARCLSQQCFFSFCILHNIATWYFRSIKLSNLFAAILQMEHTRRFNEWLLLLLFCWLPHYIWFYYFKLFSLSLSGWFCCCCVCILTIVKYMFNDRFTRTFLLGLPYTT